MAVLVLLNGAPASGKSTIAHAWAERHGDRMPVAFDVDVLRAMIGGWHAAPNAAGTAARRMAFAAIRTALADDRDVVVPQYVRRPEFVDALRDLATEAGAVFVECAVRVPADLADRRFREREAEALAAADARGGSRGPHGPIVHGGLGGDRMVDVVDELEAFLAARPGVVWIDAGDARDTRVGRGADAAGVDAAVDQLDAAVDAARRTARTASSGTSPNRSSSSTGTHSGT